MRTIGVISDTHGLLRPEAVEALAGSALIVHAGDVGRAEILERLAEIAPVKAVRGNTDGAAAGPLPETEVVDLATQDGVPSDPPEGLLAYVLHDLAELDLDPEAAGFRVVISGHTHRPLVEERDGVLYLNPGSAGPPRFSLPVTVARLYVEGRSVRAEIKSL
jgi:putative phosphoesterase